MARGAGFRGQETRTTVVEREGRRNESASTSDSLERWRHTEYEQVCADWRHRDGMLWQSLAVAITVTGLTLSLTVSDEPMPWLLRAGLFFLAFLLNLVVLLKIVKDNYYQHGSSEIMRAMTPVPVLHDLGVADSPRIHKPSRDYSDERIASVHPRWLYDWLARQSTFGLFFAVEVFLAALTGGAFLYCLVAYAMSSLAG